MSIIKDYDPYGNYDPDKEYDPYRSNPRLDMFQTRKARETQDREKTLRYLEGLRREYGVVARNATENWRYSTTSFRGEARAAKQKGFLDIAEKFQKLADAACAVSLALDDMGDVALCLKFPDDDDDDDDMNKEE